MKNTQLDNRKPSARTLFAIDMEARLKAVRTLASAEGIQIRHVRKKAMVGPLQSLSIVGGLTVAYRQGVDAAGKPDSFIEVATAICKSNENYNRRIGTVFAIERFKAGNTIRLPLNDYSPEVAIEIAFGGLMTHFIL